MSDKNIEKRLFLRNEMREHNKKLVEAAQQAGVDSNLDFAIFQNHGYKGLYGGLGQDDSRSEGAEKELAAVRAKMAEKLEGLGVKK
jgi:hypothetical protein